MNIWDILEIEYTTDENKIRDAYANCAKKYHPEEYPEEFKRLQTAYKQALKIARNVKENPERLDVIEKFKEPYENEDEEILCKNDAYEEFLNMYEEIPEVYDYSMVSAGGEKNDNIRKEFFWRFKQLYNFSYTKNNVKAWKILMEDADYKPLFESSDFLSELSVVIGGMQCISRDVWKYMIQRFEAHAYVIKCDVYIDHIKERMMLNSGKYTSKPFYELSNLSGDEQIIVAEIMTMGKKEGKINLKILQMDYFVPYLFYVLHRREKRVNTEASQQMSDELLFRHEIRPSLFAKILLVFYIILIIYCGIMLVTGNGKKNAETQTSHDEYIESIIENLQEDLKNQYYDDPIIESIEENMRNKQDR